MPLGRLDPNMLIGFVVRDEAEWVDLRRIKELGCIPCLAFGVWVQILILGAQLSCTIFAIADEPPTCPGADEDEMGLESLSDPVELEEDAGVDDARRRPSCTRARHGSNSTTHSASTSNSGGVETEEDPVAPITPLPSARFDLSVG
ncbi:hypothetical protein B0H19DRAFT_1253633 [Mycena capillaripes]|nr:hypothetical protein B0H19DRAFT_1253633 [Mycena capillaripes]